VIIITLLPVIGVDFPDVMAIKEHHNANAGTPHDFVLDGI